MSALALEKEHLAQQLEASRAEALAFQTENEKLSEQLQVMEQKSGHIESQLGGMVQMLQTSQLKLLNLTNEAAQVAEQHEKTLAALTNQHQADLRDLDLKHQDFISDLNLRHSLELQTIKDNCGAEILQIT